MNIGLEVEAKFELSRSGFERLLGMGRVRGVADQLNVYYDCDGALAALKSTFRVRFSQGALPVVTLKVLKYQDAETRASREIELCAQRAFNMKSFDVRVPRMLHVQRDLAEEFRAELLAMNAFWLHRLGAVRNRRHVVEFAPWGVIELDHLRLPGGRHFFEAEVETADTYLRSALIALLQKTIPDVNASTISKFERFRRAVAALGPRHRPSPLIPHES